ncbi:MAG TPA: hypothetical protein PKU91_03680, partial [Phycisphaerales bacterium]|nr:hypothetical protein [Phycisphaerales bacterium]
MILVSAEPEFQVESEFRAYVVVRGGVDGRIPSPRRLRRARRMVMRRVMMRWVVIRWSGWGGWRGRRN